MRFTNVFACLTTLTFFALVVVNTSLAADPPAKKAPKNEAKRLVKRALQAELDGQSG